MVKRLSKKALALMLVMFMIIGSIDLSAFEIVYASEVNGSESGSYDSSDKKVLDELGFDLTAEGSYKTDELNAGLRTINSLQEIVLERSGSKAKYRVFDSDVSKDSGLYNLHDKNSNSSLAEEMTLDGNYNYSLVSSFDGDGDGKNEYVAKVSLSNAENGGDIVLSVYKVPTSELTGDEGYKDVFVNVPIGGHIVTDTEIPQYCYVGLLNIATGDFDGDGIDEVAVYSPNNQNETKDGSVTNTLEIKIYDIDVNSNELPEPTQVIDLANGAYGYKGNAAVSEWKYSYQDGKKQYYSIPYASLTADDANGDGIDDLLVCTSFQEEFRGFSKSSCDTWAEVLEPENAFTSVFDLYEGGDAGLNHTIVKRPLVGKTSGGGYVLRGATAIVANVSAPNSREIVFGGNYTKIDYEENINMNKVVNDTRAISRTDDSPRVIAGYTTYADLVGDNTTSASLDYSWETSYGIGYKVYEKNMSDAYEPVAMAGFAPYGTAFEDTIFVEGIFFGTGTGGALEVKYKLTNTDTDKTTSTAGTGNRKRWIASVAVGNVSGSAIGEEAIYINWYIHSRYDGIFAYVLSARGKIKNGTRTYTDVEGAKLEKYDTVYNVYTVDIDNDSSFIRYEEGDTDIYYGDVEVLSILQAAPIWGEFDDMYLNDAETSYAKIKGSAFEETAGASLTAGVVVGLEEKTSFLGLFTVAGIDFEIAVSASVGYESSKTTSTEYSTEYTTVGDSDTAVIFTVPYVRYNCETYLPEYSLPTKEEYTAKKAFVEELEANIIEYIDKRAGITGGAYSKPADGYNDGYTTDVNYANYDYQLGLYQNYIEWLTTTEETMAEFDAGGTCEWGQVMPGGWQDYYYCIPQDPILTTVDVATYDEIAKNTKGLTPIYGNVFDEDYRAGDPSTYPKSVTELNAVGKVLSGQTGEGSETDTGGFVTCSPISSSNSAVSQSISITTETSEAVTYGASIETSLTSVVGPAKVGATACVEAGGSSAWISTVGSEYSGAVPNLPDYADSQYSYGWKLVSYTTSLNGKQIPVVGYLVKMQQTPPPSVPEGITLTDLTDRAIKLEWYAGEREAAAYEVYRVTTANNRTYYDLVESVTESVNGTYECVDDGLGNGLNAKTTYEYVIKAVSADGVESIYSDSVFGTTLPSNMSFGVTLKGLDSNTECIAGKNITLSAEIDSDSESRYAVRSYNWQVDDGTGWKDLGVNKANYVLKTSTLKNGYQYRCKVEVRVGNVVTGDIYELYSNVVTQNARRAGTKVSLKTDGDVGTTANFGLINQSRKFGAIILPETDMDEVVDGNVIYTVSSDVLEEQITYEAGVTDGVAEVDIPFEKVGKYVITVEYGGDKNCESSKTEKAYEYYVYDGANSEIDFNNETAASVALESQTYIYTGEQICPKVTLTWNETVLVEDVDYIVIYGENVEVGKGTLSIIPIGNYAGGIPRTETFDITHEHDYEAATCTTPKKCKICGETEGEALDHLYADEYTIDKPAGCETKGSKSRHCVNCTATTDVKEIEAVGHQKDEGTVIKEANCKEVGTKVYTCITCNAILETEELETIAHQADGGTVIQPATCTETGIKEYKCTGCGIVLSTETIAVSDHQADGGTVTQPATCTEAGIKEYKCTGCGIVLSTETIEATGHQSDEGTVTQKASCTEAGTKVYSCKVCSVVLNTEAIAATGHKPGESTATKAATCTEAGEKVQKCTECSVVLNTEAIAATGHKPGECIVTKKATCTKDGTKEQKCTECNEVLKTEKIKATGHKSNKGVVTKQPTTTKKGVKTYSCTVCKAVIKKESIAKLPKKGAKLVVSGVTYKVTKAGAKNGTVSFVSAKKNSKTITVPETVKYQNVTYKVTSIEKNAFKNQKKVTKITIGKNVTKIGATAFTNCTKLKTIKIQTTKLTKSGLSKTAFKGVKTSVKIYVPSSKVKTYTTLFRKAGLSSKVKVKK